MFTCILKPHKSHWYAGEKTEQGEEKSNENKVLLDFRDTNSFIFFL